jgi:hypothetical protein
MLSFYMVGRSQINCFFLIFKSNYVFLLALYDTEPRETKCQIKRICSILKYSNNKFIQQNMTIIATSCCFFHWLTTLFTTCSSSTLLTATEKNYLSTIVYRSFSYHPLCLVDYVFCMFSFQECVS